MRSSLGDSVIDDVMDAYVEWREESAEVESAYRRWAIAPPIDTALAFAAYVAALDREHLASIAYARVIRRAIVLREGDSELRDAA